MKPFPKSLLLSIFIGLSPLAAFAGPFEDGMQAYDTKDYVKAAKFYQQAADQGHAMAQHRLGVLYINGQGVAQSDVRAADEFGKAAKQGLPIAQYYLGVLYQHGRGVVKSKQRAAELFRVAADQDVPAAQYSLALLYFYGQGLPQSKEVAIIWLKKAAALGDLNALAQLDQFGIQ